MVNEIDSLKCSIKIDYDIPFDFTEERELAFENIVNKLYAAIGKNKGVKILANYTTNTDIDIYKSTDSSISKAYFKGTIKGILALINKSGVKVIIKNKVYSYDRECIYRVDFYVEFSNSDNFKITKDESTNIKDYNSIKDSTNKDNINKDSTDNDTKDDKEDDNGLVNVEVKFNAAVDKNFVDMFKSTVDHHIEYLIDLDSFPEIKCIFGATTKVLGSEGLVYPSNN